MPCAAVDGDVVEEAHRSLSEVLRRLDSGELRSDRLRRLAGLVDVARLRLNYDEELKTVTEDEETLPDEDMEEPCVTPLKHRGAKRPFVKMLEPSKRRRAREDQDDDDQQLGPDDNADVPVGKKRAPEESTSVSKIMRKHDDDGDNAPTTSRGPSKGRQQGEKKKNDDQDDDQDDQDEAVDRRRRRSPVDDDDDDDRQTDASSDVTNVAETPRREEEEEEEEEGEPDDDAHDAVVAAVVEEEDLAHDEEDANEEEEAASSSPQVLALGKLSALPPEVALAVAAQLNAAELGRLECCCRAARGTPGLVELAILRVKRFQYGVQTLPVLSRETWPKVLQRWEWTRSSRSLSTRMDGVAAAFENLDLFRSRRRDWTWTNPPVAPANDPPPEDPVA
eukprot:CAMPEP_0118913800 /NCGR_PEP_ID=MMETSP1166-20130328/14442_1 /TAXON_ID=1104430 /ORGANISM="Chrysoreinhardia sp, Strain CCMP3193" /LENGTH=391 /DNA_ID=CAMNT_0006853365 /DNA_START=78 /DNA_END=1253 /DNA_ORIENTATION=+